MVCGGGGGLMEAVCRGARESPHNAYVEFPVFTGIGYARNVAVVLSGEAVIAIDGAYGTLSEIAYALIHEIPLVGLDTWDFSYHGHDADRIVRAKDPVEAVEKAIALAQQRRPDGPPSGGGSGAKEREMAPSALPIAAVRAREVLDS